MATTDLVTLQEAKEHLEITGTSRDAVLMGLISGASLMLARWCRVPLVSTQYVERHTGGQNNRRGGAKTIFLHRYPIISVTSVVDESSTPQSLVEGSDYYVNKALGTLEHFSSFPAPYKGSLLGEWIVTYTAGRFASTSVVEANVKLACNLLIARLLASKAAGVGSMNTGTLSVNFLPTDGTLPADVAGMMAPYKGNRI